MYEEIRMIKLKNMLMDYVNADIEDFKTFRGMATEKGSRIK